MQIAKRVYSLAQEQNNSALMIGAYRALAVTFYFLGDFESARQYTIRGVHIWRSGGVQSPVEEITAPAVTCLCFEALLDWHFGKISSCRATSVEAIALAKELKDMHALAVALHHAAVLGSFVRNPAEVEGLASDLIELSTRHNFAYWLAAGEVHRGWAHSAAGATAEGVARIEDGIDNWQGTGSTVWVPYFLSLKAEALHLTDRTAEALETIIEAEASGERSEERWWSAELQRLRGVFHNRRTGRANRVICRTIRAAAHHQSGMIDAVAFAMNTIWHICGPSRLVLSQAWAITPMEFQDQTKCF